MSDAQESLLGRRILVVEDEYVIAMELEGWLRGAGAEVIGPVPTVEQALDRIEVGSGTLDGAVLDVDLRDGERVYPVADRLDALGVPYLFATGDVQIGSELIYRGCIRLEKPVLRIELLRAVEALVSSSRGTETRSS